MSSARLIERVAAAMQGADSVTPAERKMLVDSLQRVRDFDDLPSAARRLVVDLESRTYAMNWLHRLNGRMEGRR